MKKRMMVLAALTLSMAVSAAAWAGTFDDYYDYRNEDGTYSYYFTADDSQGLFVTMDQEWYQNTFVMTGDAGATFYHKGSYDAYAKEGLTGGKLFTIGACVNSSFQDLPHAEYIGFDEELCMNIYADLPTDYQGYEKDQTIRVQYDALWAGVYDVIGKTRIGSGRIQSQEPEPVLSTEGTVSTTDPDYLPDEEPPVEITSGDYTYIVNSDAETITITEYNGADGAVDIPEEIDGYRVTDIGPQAFSYIKMQSLSFPAGLRSIGQRAFEYCEIPEVTIPAGVTTGICSFGYCDTLKRVMVEPGAVIQSRAFGYCDDLETVVCGAGSRLEADTFEYCRKISKVILCGDVEVSEEAFYDCDSAQMIRAEESEYDTWKQPDQDSISADLEAFLTGGAGLTPETEALETGEHRITLAGDTDVFTDCPSKAKAGTLVTMHTVDVADGEVKLEVNGTDSGTWQEWGTYTFIMPDEDVELEGWISTEGYPGA